MAYRAKNYYGGCNTLGNCGKTISWCYPFTFSKTYIKYFYLSFLSMITQREFNDNLKYAPFQNSGVRKDDESSLLSLSMTAQRELNDSYISNNSPFMSFSLQAHVEID